MFGRTTFFSGPGGSMILLISRTLPTYHFFRSRTSFCMAGQPYIMPYNFNFVRLLCRTKKKLYGRTSIFAPLVRINRRSSFSPN